MLRPECPIETTRLTLRPFRLDDLDDPRLRVLHGARCSPHDNPVERIWGALKAWLANSPTLTMAGRIRQVHAFFRQRSPAQLLATAAPHSSPWLPGGCGQNLWEAAWAAAAGPSRPGPMARLPAGRLA